MAPGGRKKKSLDDASIFSSLEKLIDQQQAKVRKSLDKLKEIIAQESVETKEMLEIYSKSLNGTATSKEMDRANDQMRDLLRVVGLGFLAVLPLAPMSIPLVVKLGEKLGVQVLPSSFRKP
jgi:hypothetical protein